MYLNKWHITLKNHFDSLLEQRVESQQPIFALEHNLTDLELNKLKQDIRRHLMSFKPSQFDWLPWVVYSTEVGYEFDGNEYWHSFDTKTPGWQQRGNRHFIRGCFKQFVDSYNGFKPSGTWANHFNIIAYPITHAILPKDLQYQLSRVLYNLRSYINRTLIQSPLLLGKKIAENSYYETKRFQRFAQSYDLIGLIAREILTVDEKGSDNVILTSAFKRIINDLRETSEAREWLDETRSVLKNKTITKGRNVRTLVPNLKLRQKEKGKWDVFIEIPDLKPLADRSQEIEKFLTSSRPKITGHLGEKRLARTYLVGHSSFQKQLETVPNNKDQLLNFRRELPKELEDFFKRDFVLNLPQYSIFNIQGNGFAEQHESRIVHPDDRYIILSSESIDDNILLNKLESSCKNVYLYSLCSEKLTSWENQESLDQLDLEVETEFDLISVGIIPTSWDQGYKVEYLDGETPQFTLKIKQSWTAVKILLEDFDELIINNDTDSESLYFCLPPLSTGLYKLSYSLQNEPEGIFQTLGELSILVKDRNIWQSGTTTQNALLLLSDPPKPTFEDLFDGKVSFEVICPENSVNVSLQLLSNDLSAKAFVDQEITSVVLPREVEILNEKIAEFVEDPKLTENAESAYLCRLNFKSEELGSVPFDFKRGFHPIRWEIKYDNSRQIILNLSEEAFGDDETQICIYDFETPDQATELSYLNYFPDYRVPETGGLFVAETPNQEKGIIILRTSKTKSFKSFSEIGNDADLTPKLKGNYERNIESIDSLIDLYGLWANSRSVGSPLSKRHVQFVLDAVIHKMMCVICEKKWRTAEESYSQSLEATNSTYFLAKSVSHKRTIQVELVNLSHLSLPNVTTEQIVKKLTRIFEFEVRPEKIVKQSKVKSVRAIIKTLNQDWFAEFALRLCSHPETIKDWVETDEKYEVGIKKMLENPSLLSAARFIALEIRNKFQRNYRWDWE